MSQSADPYKAKNLDEPGTADKVKDLITFIDRTKFCMMTTRIAEPGLLVSRAMALAAKEANGLDFLFHSNTESGKLDDLEKDSKINLAFINSSGEWASISGEAKVETNREVVREYYTPTLKAWLGDLGDGTHDGGPEDPRICVIRVKTTTAQYAVSNKTSIGAAIEVAKGAVTGEAASVHKLRQLSESEVSQWRSSN